MCVCVCVHGVTPDNVCDDLAKNNNNTVQGFIQDFSLGGRGNFVQSQKKTVHLIYIIWLSDDCETVKQISDENLTNYIIVRRRP